MCGGGGGCSGSSNNSYTPKSKQQPKSSYKPASGRPTGAAAWGKSSGITGGGFGKASVKLNLGGKEEIIFVYQNKLNQLCQLQQQAVPI